MRQSVEPFLAHEVSGLLPKVWGSVPLILACRRYCGTSRNEGEMKVHVTFLLDLVVPLWEWEADEMVYMSTQSKGEKFRNKNSLLRLLATNSGWNVLLIMPTELFFSFSLSKNYLHNIFTGFCVCKHCSSIFKQTSSARVSKLLAVAVSLSYNV